MVVAEIIGRDVHHRYRDGVAALCPFDVDRSCERMAEVEVDRRHIRGCRIEVEVGIEPIARLEHELLPRVYMGDRLDRIMNPVEAVRIVFAVLARLCHDHRRRALDVAGIGQRHGSSPREKAGQPPA